MKKTTLTSIAATSLFCLSSQAATMIWSAPEAFSNATQISTTGSLHEAKNLGNSTGNNTHTATTTVVVNGVSFAGGSGAQYGPGNKLDFYASNLHSGAITGMTATEAGDLLDGFEFSSDLGGIPGLTFRLTGLTDGQDYEVQVLMSDMRNAGYTGRVHYDGSAWIHEGIAIGASAYITTGTFTADATTQDFLTYHDQGEFAFANAIQVRAVPEPSSTALLGLGGLALILRRRR